MKGTGKQMVDYRVWSKTLARYIPICERIARWAILNRVQSHYKIDNVVYVHVY